MASFVGAFPPICNNYIPAYYFLQEYTIWLNILCCVIQSPLWYRSWILTSYVQPVALGPHVA